MRLFQGAAVAVSRAVEGEVRCVAIAEDDHERAARWRDVFPFPLTRDYMQRRGDPGLRASSMSPTCWRRAGSSAPSKRNLATRRLR